MAIMNQQGARPFELTAMVLLPDHLHAIWTLPEGDVQYPLRWKLIKEKFTNQWLARGGREGVRSTSRKRSGERAVWQRRCWEHVCRDEDDLKRFLDYLHWNPVKHGYVKRVRDWKWSSFHRYVRLGEYDLAWGDIDPWPGNDKPEWE
jgi:putative transposase